MASDALSVDVRLARPGQSFRLDVRFDVPPGITVLFGPSGSGKSTVLAAIAGLLRPDEGRIALGDDVWLDRNTGRGRPIHERRVALVFQSLALFPHLTAAQNAAYGVDRSLPSAERRRRALDCLARFRVVHLADRKPATFSGGEAQRVALARAFAMSPRVVLLDEPFSALDFTLRHEFVRELRAEAKDLGVPIVHVTHHRNEARALADRAIRIEHGRIAAHGPVDQVLPPRPRLDGEASGAPGDPTSGEDLSFAETPMADSSPDLEGRDSGAGRDGRGSAAGRDGRSHAGRDARGSHDDRDARGSGAGRDGRGSP